jgi:hypothetical protein
MQNGKKHRRKIKLIKPRLQLKLIGTFVGLSGLGFLLQALHVAHRLSELADSMPEGGDHLLIAMPRLPLEILLFSFGMLLPLTLVVGILVTHRIAGPVHRFEQHLRQVARGEQVGPCRIRKGDELRELCDDINLAIAALQRLSHDDTEERREQSVDETLHKAG